MQLLMCLYIQHSKQAQAEEKQGKKKVVSQNFNFQFNREAKRGGRGRNDGGRGGSRGGGNRGRGGFNRDNNQGRFNGRRSQQGYQKKVIFCFN